MIREALDRVIELARSASGLKIVHPDAEPPWRYLVVSPDGSYHARDAEPDMRCHQVSDVKTLADLALRFHKEWESHPNPAAVPAFPVVWYSRERAVCLFDDSVRRDRAEFKLTLAPQFETLVGLAASRRPLNHRDFLRLLRLTLAGCVPADFIATVRRLTFRQQKSGESDVRQGRASLGQSITAELTGARDLPDTVTLRSPVWRELPYTVDIECAVDVEPAEETLAIMPLPGQIDRAYRVGEAAFRVDLELAMPGIPLYYGEA